MAVGGCSARTGGWSIRSYTDSANACHLRSILSGLTMLGGIQDVYLATFAVSIGGVKQPHPAGAGRDWCGFSAGVALSLSRWRFPRRWQCGRPARRAMVVFSVLAVSSALTESRLMGAAEAVVDDADGIVGEQGVGSADVGQVQRCTRLPRPQWSLPRVCGQNRRPGPRRSGVPHIRGRPRRRCGHHGSAEPAHMVNCPFV